MGHFNEKGRPILKKGEFPFPEKSNKTRILSFPNEGVSKPGKGAS
ncbi:MAG: hypothetical protein ABGW77_00885 [Campylobacterales bacterium]